MAGLTRTFRIPLVDLSTDFYADLRASMKLATRVGNYALSRCAVVDQDIWLTDGKLPKCPKLYVYPEVSSFFPGVAGVCASICREAESTYRGFRYEIATGRRSLPIRRSFPWPVLRSMTKWTIEDGNVVVSLKLLGGTHNARLRGGSNYARQLRPIKDAIESGQLDRIRDSEVWIDRRGQVVVGVAVTLPAVNGRDLSGTIRVSTSRTALLVATKDALDTPFTINADQLFGWQAERSRKLQRLRQDRKAGIDRREVNELMDAISHKHKRRLRSLIQESVAHTVKHAIKRKVARLEYDDTIRSYSQQFPWFELRETLKNKCEESGIEFAHTGNGIGEAVVEKPHVYFKLAVDPATLKPYGKVKIGMTTNAKSRDAALVGAGGQDVVLLAADNQPKTQLRKREKHYHAMFAAHLLPGQKEWFESEPVIQWLREVGCLGNAGNLSQIQQFIDA